MRSKGIDLDSFGVKLYEPLSLPQCPGGKDEMTAFGMLFGIALGNEETCVGDTIVMQDVIALVFLAASKGVPRSPWALALLLLIAELEEHGVDEAFNLNTEAGQGYARLVRRLLHRSHRPGPIPATSQAQ